MKFLKDVSCSIEYMNSEVNWHGPFVFKSHSEAVVALNGVSHVACKAPGDSFSVFYYLVSRSHFDPQTIYFLD